MTDERYAKLMHDDLLNLTAAEIEEGWHFCPDWDGLLVCPTMGEYESCNCKGKLPYALARHDVDPDRAVAAEWARKIAVYPYDFKNG